MLEKIDKIVVELMDSYLAQEAVRYFHNSRKISNLNRSRETMSNHPVLVSDNHYHAIWQKEDRVYIHVNTVVAFCHITDPDKFCNLTARLMRKVFPNYEKVNYFGQCFSYRWITAAEWKELIESIDET